MVDDLPVPEVVEVEPMLRREVSCPPSSGVPFSWYSPVLDLLSHRQERLLNVRRVLRRCLKEGNAELVCEFL